MLAFLFVPAFAILLLLGGSARAQLPTQGAYSGKFGWWATGTPHEIDKAHVFWVGEFNGAFFNDSGHGFLHATSVVCPGFNDVVNGVSVASGGYCVVTDKDGDKAFLAWKGVQSEMGKFVGEFQWTGGTGKYTGLKGNNSYRGFAIGLTSQGYALWEGKWQTP